MLQPPRVATLAAALLISAGALAGCGDDDPPTPSPTSASPSTPTSSSSTVDPGAVEPELPDAATKPGRKGAIAFVKYYWEVVDYAQTSGDTDRLQRLQGTYCEPCSRGVDWISKIARRGGMIDGGGHELSKEQAFRTADTRIWRVTGLWSAQPSTISNAGNMNATHEGGSSRATHTVVFQNGAWSLHDWSFE